MSDSKTTSASDQIKVSCSYALEVAAQFLNLAAAGIAFVVGLVFSTDRGLLPPWVVISGGGFFALSVILGLLVRMGVVSNIYKDNNFDVYKGAIRTVATAQIVLFLFGVAVLGSATLQRTYSLGQPPAGGWTQTNIGIREGISGLALIEQEGSRTRLLAVHDNKHVGEKRLSTLEIETSGQLRTRVIPWPAADVPSDLEALACVPGVEGKFVAVTSKGQAFPLKLAPSGDQIEVDKMFQLPGQIHELEAFDLFLLTSDSLPRETEAAGPPATYLAVWSNRGDGDTPASLFWATVRSIDEAGFKDVAPESFKIRAVWPRDHVRHIADLRLCPDGTVLTVATSDPGDSGPFASALYVAGHFEWAGSPPRFVPNSSPARLFATEQHKVEALELIPGPRAGMVFGADDENHGGAVLCNW